MIVFFGYDKISSGSFLIPKTRLISSDFSSGEKKRSGKNTWAAISKKSGRYVCLGNPKEGETVISEYDLVEAFKRNYEKDEVPSDIGRGAHYGHGASQKPGAGQSLHQKCGVSRVTVARMACFENGLNLMVFA